MPSQVAVFPGEGYPACGPGSGAELADALLPPGDEQAADHGGAGV